MGREINGGDGGLRKRELPCEGPEIFFKDGLTEDDFMFLIFAKFLKLQNHESLSFPFPGSLNKLYKS